MPACDAWVERMVTEVTEEAEDREFERHLASCPGCRAEAQMLAGTVAALQKTHREPEDLSLAGFSSRVAERAEEFRDRSARGLWWTAARGTRFALGASLATLAASVALVLLRPTRPGPVAVAPSAPLALAQRSVAPVQVTGTAGVSLSGTDSAPSEDSVSSDDIESDMQMLASPQDAGQDDSMDSAFSDLSNSDLQAFDQMLDRNPS